MFRTAKLTACLAAGICTAAFLAHGTNANAAPADRDDHNNGPVARIYISSTPTNSSANEIDGFTAQADGRLKPMDNSPFQENLSSMSINGGTLFGINQTIPEIDAFSIEANGRLRYRSATNYAAHNPNDCGSAAWLFPDRTGKDLYAMEFNRDCANNAYASFELRNQDGGLQYLGAADGGAGSFSGIYLPASFLGNDRFAYEATNNSCMYYQIWGFRRQNDGLLTTLDISAKLPAPPAGYRIYIPTMAAADPVDHVAISLQAANPPGCSSMNSQIASFTADQKGNLTTTNTPEEMPSSAVGNVSDLKISPSGRLIAIAGSGGIQVFHFNGARPVTRYTRLLTRQPINQMFWDNDNHLYAISQSANKLYVFVITPSVQKQAPGSPYAISSPQNIAVQPLPVLSH